MNPVPLPCLPACNVSWPAPKRTRYGWKWPSAPAPGAWPRRRNCSGGIAEASEHRQDPGGQAQGRFVPVRPDPRRPPDLLAQALGRCWASTSSLLPHASKWPSRQPVTGAAPSPRWAAARPGRFLPISVHLAAGEFPWAPASMATPPLSTPMRSPQRLGCHGGVISPTRPDAGSTAPPSVRNSALHGTAVVLCLKTKPRRPVRAAGL